MRRRIVAEAGDRPSRRSGGPTTSLARALLGALATLAALALVSCGGEEATVASGAAPPRSGETSAAEAVDGRRVVLILLDAARPDRFSGWGHDVATTPRMDELAARGLSFRNHFAQGTGTRESIPSLLYSRYFTPPLFPDDPRIPYSSPDDLFRRPDDEQMSIPRAFEAAGFRTAAISAHTWMDEESGFAREFQEMQDLSKGHTDPLYPYPRAPRVVDAALEWLESSAGEDVFLYVHLMDTHYPHYFEEDAQEIFGAPGYDARRFREHGGPAVPSERLTAEDLRYIQALYDGSLRFTDREVGRLLDWLDARGPSTVAITSDHGEHLVDGPGGRPRAGVTLLGHGGPWLDPVARIPFLLAGPNVASGVSEGWSEGVDVLPTLLSAAGVPVPAGVSFDGIDLLEVIRGEAGGKSEVVTRGGSLRTSGHKVLFRQRDRLLLRDPAPTVDRLGGRLFDLEADPWEADDRFADELEVVADLLARYRERLRAPYARYERALGTEPPDRAFAISSRYLRTDGRIPSGPQPAASGWSRVPGQPHTALVARGDVDPLAVRLRLPDGVYHLSVGFQGRLVVRAGNRRRGLETKDGTAVFGEVEVEDETLHLEIEPASPDLAVYFLGFVPAGVEIRDSSRGDRLRSLGYVD